MIQRTNWHGIEREDAFPSKNSTTSTIDYERTSFSTRRRSARMCDFLVALCFTFPSPSYGRSRYSVGSMAKASVCVKANSLWDVGNAEVVTLIPALDICKHELARKV